MYMDTEREKEGKGESTMLLLLPLTSRFTLIYHGLVKYLNNM